MGATNGLRVRQQKGNRYIHDVRVMVASPRGKWCAWPMALSAIIRGPRVNGAEWSKDGITIRSDGTYWEVATTGGDWVRLRRDELDSIERPIHDNEVRRKRDDPTVATRWKVDNLFQSLLDAVVGGQDPLEAIRDHHLTAPDSAVEADYPASAWFVD